MKQLYCETDNCIFEFEKKQDQIDKIPLGTYVLKQNPMSNKFYFEKTGNFQVNHKIYGRSLVHCERILNTFDKRAGSTGVLLSGEKGSGKTLLAKLISQQGILKNYVTIIINRSFCGDEFNSFISRIEQPCIVIFDEFEKVYDGDSQDAILTLLDGVILTKKLFILTINEESRISYHMKNRPGRIFYYIEYSGIDEKFVREYCEDNLKNKEQIDRVCSLPTICRPLNFDMLQCVVEEMNRYDETFEQALEILNVRVSINHNIEYSVSVIRNGEKIQGMDNETISFNPIFQESFRVTYRTEGIDGDGDPIWDSLSLSQNDLVRLNTKTGEIKYNVKDKNDVYDITFTLKKEQKNEIRKSLNIIKNFS